MANKRYPLGAHHFATAGVNWDSNDIKIAAIKAAYTYSATHEFVTDLGANIIARSPNLGTKSSTAGVLLAASPTFPLLTGVQVQYLVIFKDTGVDATSPLLYYIDTAQNLPFLPNGTDLVVQPDPPTGFFQV